MTLVLEPLPDSELVLGGAKQTGDLVTGGFLLASCTSFFPRPRPDAAAASPISTPHFSNYGCVCLVCVSAALSLGPPAATGRRHIISIRSSMRLTSTADSNTTGQKQQGCLGIECWIEHRMDRPNPPPPPALSQERYPAIL